MSPPDFEPAAQQVEPNLHARWSEAQPR